MIIIMRMSSQSNEMRNAFDAAAADFDALGHYLWDPIGAATVAATAPAPRERVLDACCGTGASAVPAARQVGGSGHVDAVDTSGPMIDKLARRSRDLPQLHPHQADVTTWSTGDYDVVQCALGIFFFPDMAAGTDRLVSLARPGGRVGFTIWRGRAMELAGQHLGRAVAKATNSAPPAERKPHLIDQINQADNYADWLTGRALTKVDVFINELRLVMTTDLAWLVVLGSGFRAALAKLAPDQVATVRALYLQSLHDDGVFELDATTLIGVGTRPR